jgi:hypothetical protein
VGYGPLDPGRTAAGAPDGRRLLANEQSGIIGDQTYRLVVYWSSSLDQRPARSLDRDLAQLRAGANRPPGTLAQEDFACALGAEAAAAAFRAQAPRWWPCTTTVQAGTGRDKRPHPGRPRRDAPPPTHTVYRVQVTWGLEMRRGCGPSCSTYSSEPYHPTAMTLRPGSGSITTGPVSSSDFISSQTRPL